MGDLQNAVPLKELWADSGVDQATLSDSFKDVTMNFNTQQGSVTVASN